MEIKLHDAITSDMDFSKEAITKIEAMSNKLSDFANELCKVANNYKDVLKGDEKTNVFAFQSIAINIQTTDQLGHSSNAVLRLTKDDDASDTADFFVKVEISKNTGYKL